jgi:hypothetical protein
MIFYEHTVHSLFLFYETQHRWVEVGKKILGTMLGGFQKSFAGDYKICSIRFAKYQVLTTKY